MANVFDGAWNICTATVLEALPQLIVSGREPFASSGRTNVNDVALQVVGRIVSPPRATVPATPRSLPVTVIVSPGFGWLL